MIIKEPGKASVVEPLFDNDLKAFQDAVGGYIETVTFGELVFICNEEWRLQGRPSNVLVNGVEFGGTVIVARAKDEAFASLRASSVPFVMGLLKEGIV